MNKPIRNIDGTPRVCIVCDQAYPRGEGCTNRCCTDCHRKFCTSGGITSPGHDINIAAARATVNPWAGWTVDSKATVRVKRGKYAGKIGRVTYVTSYKSGVRLRVYIPDLGGGFHTSATNVEVVDQRLPR